MAAREGTPPTHGTRMGAGSSHPFRRGVIPPGLSETGRERRRWRRFGGIAQLVEHVLCKHEVTGSIPVASTSPDFRLVILDL
jgi:hypothetical protein